MNHVITVGDLLRVLAYIFGAVVVVVGLIIFASGALANPETGESDGPTCSRGARVLAVGIAIIAALLLTGCGTTAAIQTRTVQVDVPVAVHPIDPKKIPIPPPPLGPRPETAPQAADKAFSGWCAAVAYIIRAVPLLDAGAGLAPSQAPDYPECRKH